MRMEASQDWQPSPPILPKSGEESNKVHKLFWIAVSGTAFFLLVKYVTLTPKSLSQRARGFRYIALG